MLNKIFLSAFFILGISALNAQTTYTFDGIDDYVTVPKTGTSIVNNFSSPHDFTVEIRFKYNKTTNATGNWPVVCMISPGLNGTQNGFYIEIPTGTKNLRAGMASVGNSNYTRATSTIDLSNTTFYTATLAYKHMTKTFQYFFDGVQVGGDNVLPAAFVPETTYALALAKSLYWRDNSPITIDFFRVWTMTRTQAEVNANKLIEVPCDAANLLLQYKFDYAPLSTIATDCTTNALNGTIFGGATVNVKETSRSLGVRIAPTLVQSVLTVEDASDYEIVNVTGQVVAKRTAHQNQVNVSHLSAGMYFVRGQVATGQFFVEKIVKE